MKIAINTRFLLHEKLEGIGIYTQEIFKRVVQLMPEHQFYFLFDRAFDDAFIYSNNVTAVVVSPPARHPFLWYWWFERSIPKVLKEYQIDLFISPDGYASLNTNVPQIITIHDLAFEHYKEHTPFLVYQYYKYFVPKFCKKASKIMAVSEFTKQDIINRYKIDSNKINVIYNGFENKNETILNPTSQSSKLKAHNYFIFIGAVHPRKNVLGILKAYEHFRATFLQKYKLVIIGRKAWMNNELESFYNQMQFKNDVVWIEKIERNNLLQILQHAFALVYPSFFEGFGIPIIEAMSYGVPVITSNVSCMPEIAGNAAILINPSNTNEIANAMNELIINNKLYSNLKEKGKIRAQDFNWNTSAKKVVDTINATLKNLQTK